MGGVRGDDGDGRWLTAGVDSSSSSPSHLLLTGLTGWGALDVCAASSESSVRVGGCEQRRRDEKKRSTPVGHGDGASQGRLSVSSFFVIYQ